MSKVYYLPKFAPGGKTDEYFGGNLKGSKVSSSLSRDQWNNLYKQDKVSLTQIPRKYQSWIKAENSSFKRGITNAIDNFGTKYVSPVILGGVTGPGGMIAGLANTALDIGINSATKGEKTSWGDLLLDKDKYPIGSTLLELTNPLNFITVGSINKYKSLTDLPSITKRNTIELLPWNWRIIQRKIPRLNKNLGRNLGETPKVPFDFVGSESSVYVGPKRVLKIYNEGTAPQTLEELEKFNKKFISTRNNFPLAEPLRVEGYVKSHIPGKYYPVYSQRKVTPLSTDDDLLDAKNLEEVLKEIDKTMNRYGIMRSGSVYTSPSGLHMSDLKSSNIGIDKSGNYTIFDGDVWKQGGKINGNDQTRN